MNIKKLFAVLAGGAMLAAQWVAPVEVIAANDELQSAYDWAYENGITTMPTIEAANMGGEITRAQMAKMLANYAKEFTDKKMDTSTDCDSRFTDVASVKGDLSVAIVEACQFGIMGQGITAFRPYDSITRAEFGTALSRLLWGDENEGGTPYYANHLKALQAAGIMTKIDNATARNEIRGYVMIMLQRAAELTEEEDVCDDPLVMSACVLDDESCPAQCREEEDNKADEKDDEVVKAGDLAVTARAATERKAIVPSAVSDLDTLTFKTSEEVEISKITLERYGYSSSSDVAYVSLEDQDGNVIADGKALNSKDQVTLSIKKDYRTVDGSYVATVVLETSANAQAGGTIGFKVVSVDSTAENLNLDDYTPYTYDMVNYGGASISIEAKGTAKNYNYEAGESYEVARFKVNAGASAVYVKGFTLTNKAGSPVDVAEFLDKVTVLADGEEVKAKYSVNKDDQLVISFDEYEIASKKSATFVVNMSFADDFDDYGRSIKYAIEKTTDFNATEKKTETRVTVTVPALSSWVAHQFNGGKIRLTNVKTSNVEAAAGSDDVVVAEGSITVTEAVKLPTITISADNLGVSDMSLVIAGEEYDGSRTINYWCQNAGGTFFDHEHDTWNTAAKCVAHTATNVWAGETLSFEFNGVEIEKSGKVKILVDLDKDATGTVTFDPSTLNRNIFDGARYVDARQDVVPTDVAGSISFASKLTVQAAKAALENKLSKSVEFVMNETNRKVVFDGTYTARKGDVYLNSFLIDGTVFPSDTDANDIEYYVFVDGEEIGNTSALNSEEIFSDVKVKAGESVSVKVEASVTADDTTPRTYNMTLSLKGEDADGNEAGIATEAMKSFSTVTKGAVEVSTSTSKKTIALRAANSNIATFIVKPSNSDDEIMLEDLAIEVRDSSEALSSDSFRVKVDSVEQYEPTTETKTDPAYTAYVYEINEDLPSEGLKVTVDLKAEADGEYTVNLRRVNGKTYTTAKQFNKQFVPAVAYISAQEDLDGTTKFTLAIDGKAESSYTLANFCVYKDIDITKDADSDGKVDSLLGCYAGEFEDGNTFEVPGDTTSVQMIKAITYIVEGATTPNVTVKYSTMPDYFKVAGNDARVYKVKN